MYPELTPFCHLTCCWQSDKARHGQASQEKPRAGLAHSGRVKSVIQEHGQTSRDHRSVEHGVNGVRPGLKPTEARAHAGVTSRVLLLPGFLSSSHVLLLTPTSRGRRVTVFTRVRLMLVRAAFRSWSKERETHSLLRGDARQPGSYFSACHVKVQTQKLKAERKVGVLDCH